MKKVTMFLLVALFLVSGLFAQENKFTVSAVGGYAMSAFEDQDDAAGALPVGVLVGYKLKPNLVVGGELNMALGGFSWELEQAGYKITSTANQTLIGAFGKYYFSEGQYVPYGKVGVGMYTGDGEAKVEYQGQSQKETIKIDSAIGFNVGGGVLLPDKGIFAEFVYHIVSREASGESSGMNYWAIQVGYQIIR